MGELELENWDSSPFTDQARQDIKVNQLGAGTCTVHANGIDVSIKIITQNELLTKIAYLNCHLFAFFFQYRY